MSGHTTHGLFGRLTSLSYRYSYLLIALGLVIFVRPFVTRSELGPLLLDLFLYASLLTGALAGATRPRHAAATWALVGIAVAMRVVWRNSDATWALVAFLAVAALVHAIVATLLLRGLFRRKSGVDADTIQGAVAVYLLLGVTWTFAFALLELLQPGSFNLGDSQADLQDQFSRLVGFSFTTLTTLGYGNVHPLTPRADALATAEAISGVFYIGVLVARLIGIQIAEHSLRLSQPDPPESS